MILESKEVVAKLANTIIVVGSIKGLNAKSTHSMGLRMRARKIAGLLE